MEFFKSTCINKFPEFPGKVFSLQKRFQKREKKNTSKAVFICFVFGFRSPVQQWCLKISFKYIKFENSFTRNICFAKTNFYSEFFCRVFFKRRPSPSTKSNDVYVI